MKKVLSKVQKVRAISAYQKNYEGLLEKTDALANRMMKSFDNPSTKFSAAQVKKIASNLEEVANKVASGLKGCFTNLRVAIASEVPTDRIVAHVEDAHTLLSKIAILKAQAIASIAADEDIQMDESGQLVEEAPMEEAPEEEAEEEKSPEELAQDIHDDLDLLVQELSGEAPEAEEPEAKEAKVAKKEKAEANPDMPTSNKDNPKAEEPKDVLKLQDSYEHAPSNKNAKKKSADSTVAAEAEMNPDMPEKNPDMDEESLEELVEEYEKSPSDPENLEMEDSMIDDAVNVEILSDGDVDTMEDEVIKSSASLKSRKLASAKKTEVSEEDVMAKILSESMF